MLRLDGRSTDALVMRARERQQAALAAWQAPPSAGVDRDRLAREGLAAARADLRAALAVSPTNPWIHMDLAWVEASDAVVHGRHGSDGLAAALTHGSRAVALGADSPLFYAAMARQYFQAINEWRTLKEQAPTDVDTRLALARALEKINQPGDAYREYRALLDVAPDQPDAARAVARLEGRRR